MIVTLREESCVLCGQSILAEDPWDYVFSMAGGRAKAHLRCIEMEGDES